MNDPDVLIIGGGPAGACAASTLALAGRTALVIEKEPGPRYHIGESFIPFCAYPLARIGFLDKLKASRFTKKYSVVFVGTTGTASRPFWFHQYLYDGAAVTWQVLRSEFDAMLLAHAESLGATVQRGVEATALIIEGGVVRGARVRGPDGEREVRAAVTIDCGGRDALSHRTFAWRDLDPGLDRFALWGYFEGHRLDEGVAGGATVVASIPGGGWFWWIPVTDGRLSCGVVARREDLFVAGETTEQTWARALAQQPWVADRLSAARRVEPLRVIREYSYRARHAATDGLVLAGDAFGFLDPIFSSGVFLALRGGELAAQAADAALTQGDTSARAFADYGARMSAGIENIRRLVYAFYDKGFSLNQVMTRDPYARSDISDLLDGCFFRDYEDFFSICADSATLPGPLSDGRPIERAASRRGAAPRGDAQRSERAD